MKKMLEQGVKTPIYLWIWRGSAWCVRKGEHSVLYCFSS